MKTIFFLIPTIERGGGAERVCIFLAEQLHKRGYPVAIQLLIPTDKESYPVNPEIKVYAPLSYRFGTYGAVLHFLFLCLLRREFPSCVIAFLWPANVFASILSRLKKIKIILTERCNPKQDPPDQKSYCRTKKQIKNISSFIAQTTACAEFMKSYLNIPDSKMRVIFNPISPRVLDSSKKFQNSFLLAVGRLTEQKGFDRLIRIFAKVNAKFPDQKLIICGDGPKKKELMQQAESLGILSKIQWAGNVKNIDDYFQNAHVLLFTSRYEGMPNALLESYANGCPAISFDLEFGPRDIITDGVNGFLVPQDDETAFVHALIHFLKNPELKNKFAANIPLVLKKFDSDHIVDLWEDEIQKIIGKKH